MRRSIARSSDSRLGGGSYIVARHVGDSHGVHAAIDRLVDALRDCDVARIADAPVHVLYHDDPDQVAASNLRADIFVPIEESAYGV